jgi:hypothetical protein
MGTRKIVGIVLLVVGILALAAFLLADVIGFGGPGFGTRQVTGTIVGAAALVVGVVLLAIKK